MTCSRPERSLQPIAAWVFALVAAGLHGCADGGGGSESGQTAAPTSPGAPGANAAAPPTGLVRVGVAASLRPLLDSLASAQTAAHPGLRFQVQSAGSQVLVRKALELGEPFDVLVLADPVLLQQLRPDWSAFHVVIATDRLVLARATGVDAAALTADNAFDVLLQDDVVLGMANPDLAPLGYRTQLSWMLAEEVLRRPGLAQRLRARVGQRHLYPDASALLAPLQTGELDYALMYGAAVMGAGIGYIELPLSMSLGDPRQSDAYGRVQVEVRAGIGDARVARVGAPVTYAATIAAAADNPAGARALLSGLLSPAGHTDMRKRGLRPYGSEVGRWHGTPPPGLRDAVAAAAQRQ